MIQAPLSLATASLRLDAALGRSRHLPMTTRLPLLAGKYAAIPALLRGQSAHLPVGSVRMHLRTLSDLGTAQSAIVDAHDTLVAARVLSAVLPAVVAEPRRLPSPSVRRRDPARRRGWCRR